MMQRANLMEDIADLEYSLSKNYKYSEKEDSHTDSLYLNIHFIFSVIVRRMGKISSEATLLQTAS